MREIIRVNDMTKDYGEGRGIFGFDFAVEQGEVFGIVGTNGSGKTTTLRHLMGFLKPDSGSCSIMGLDCRKDAHKIMKHVGYVPGEIDFPDVGTGTSFLKIQAGFLGIKDTSRIERLVDMFKLDTDASLRRMSKGMKQKTALVAAFMAQPDILLLDEPSTGLDPLMRDTLIELILEEKKRRATVLMSSHIFKELDDTADRVLFIDSGRQTELIETKSIGREQPQTYRLGFKSREDLDRFIKTTRLRVLHKNETHLHLDAAVPEQSLGELFSETADYDMRYMKYRPFSLESYYTEAIEKGGKKSA
ncbi:MAG: ABC transporter ATP-binding protein [Ruminococcus sp.]|nr:ABC transporter ATP-binding protein [Ruminococcus sp.]